MSHDDKIIRLSHYRAKRLEAKTSKPAHLIVPDTPNKSTDEICSEALAAMLVELEKHGVDGENTKLIMRSRIINRLLHETIDEVHHKKPMSNWMKELLLHF